MITDEELEAKEAEINALFGKVEDGPPVVPPQPTAEDERRIEQIMVRVRVEALMKDTASFVFQSFGTTMSGVLRAMFGVFPSVDREVDQDDPNRNPDK